MNQIINILKEGITGSIHSVFNIALIVFPLMIAMEIAKDVKILDKLANFCKPLTNRIGIAKEAALPLAVGLFFGLVYGAGVIIQSSKEGNLDKRSLILVSIFLVCCHAIVEDTFILVAIGANGLLLFSIRLITAFLVTLFISKKVLIMKDK